VMPRRRVGEGGPSHERIQERRRDAAVHEAEAAEMPVSHDEPDAPGPPRSGRFEGGHAEQLPIASVGEIGRDLGGGGIGSRGVLGNCHRERSLVGRGAFGSGAVLEQGSPI
jgi:hypothetical protein